MDKPLSLKEKYIKLLADHITVSVEDLTENELKLINFSYDLFKSKLNDMKTLEDDIKRLSLDLVNCRAMYGRDSHHTTDEDE